VGELHSGYFAPHRCDTQCLRYHLDRFLSLVRQNVAKPANCAGEGDDCAKHTHGVARTSTREQQRDSQRKDNRPGSRRRHLDHVGGVVVTLVRQFETHVLPFLAADYIYDDEYNHPNHIHEVPVHRQNLGTLGVLPSYIPEEREDQHRHKSEKADRYVKCM
jgi:hypothetical protein